MTDDDGLGHSTFAHTRTVIVLSKYEKPEEKKRYVTVRTRAKATDFLTGITCNNNKIVIIITKTIFMVLSSWLRTIARVHPVYLMNADSAPDCYQPLF